MTINNEINREDEELLRTILIYFEGNKNHMYRDSRGYVTTGIGTLLEHRGRFLKALELKWYKPDGQVANADEILAEATKVKRYGEKVISLRLDEHSKINALNKHIRRDLEIILADPVLGEIYYDLPQNARLGLRNLQYQTGSVTRRQNLKASLRNKDFEKASRFSGVIVKNSSLERGIIKRNEFNRQLFKNAGKATSLPPFPR